VRGPAIPRKLNPDLKQSVQLPEAMRAEIAAEAQRLGRTRSGVVCLAWTLARERLRAVPSAAAEMSAPFRGARSR